MPAEVKKWLKTNFVVFSICVFSLLVSCYSLTISRDADDEASAVGGRLDDELRYLNDRVDELESKTEEWDRNTDEVSELEERVDSFEDVLRYR